MIAIYGVIVMRLFLLQTDPNYNNMRAAMEIAASQFEGQFLFVVVDENYLQFEI